MHQIRGRRPWLHLFQITANVWNISKIPMFFCCFHNSSLTLNIATLSTDLNGCSPLKWQIEFVEQGICNTIRQVLQPILCPWSMLPVVTVFLKEISRAALIAQKLWPVTYLQKAISFLCIRVYVCALCPTPHRTAKCCKVLQCTLQNVKFFFNVKFFVQKMDIFWQVSICLWITYYVDSHSEATSLTQVVKRGSCPVMAAAPSNRYTNTKWPIQFSWYVIIQRLK